MDSSTSRLHLDWPEVPIEPVQNIPDNLRSNEYVMAAFVKQVLFVLFRSSKKAK